MKIPLRFQVTEFDCGTVSLLNAFSYLFNREEIPALLVKSIFKYTLDCYDEEGNLGQGGTSREAIKKLTNWITKYTNENNFNVKCTRLEKEEVIFDKIKNCINNKGVIFIRCYQDCEHYVIITKITKNYIYLFDPYYLEKNYYNKDTQIKMIINKPFNYNRRVTINRMFSESKKDFSLGPSNQRECVLISKTNN